MNQINCYKSDKYVCGCGHSDDLTKFVLHVLYNHAGNVPKDSSHVIASIKPANPKSCNGFKFCLPVKIPMTDSKHLFVCPCRPTKQFEYEKFIDHVIKRHAGKIPSFVMRKESSYQY